MKAVVCTKYGTVDGLQLQEVVQPVPKQDQVLIRIFATTVTSGDVTLRNLSFPFRLVFRFFFGLGKNKILGHELAGEIEEVGPGVKRFEVGDPVFASAGFRGGAHAEYICLPEGGALAGKPTNMTYEQAAAVPVGGLTALHILRSGNIQNADKVLVYGASGSVGTYAVQIASHFGAEVTGVCSASNFDLVKSLGADQVIDYTKEDFTERGKLYDLIFDAVGKTMNVKCQKALKQGGSFVTVKSEAASEHTENLIYLKELIEAGELRAIIDRTYPMDQIAEAHRYVEKGHKKGNVVITVVPSNNLEHSSGDKSSQAKENAISGVWV